MNYDLTNQQRKVANYIFNHRGCTTKDIQRDTGITCPSGRITEIRQAGVNIFSIGKKKYPGSKAFEMYAIERPDPPPNARLATTRRDLAAIGPIH
jgi:hypothetical protein